MHVEEFSGSANDWDNFVATHSGSILQSYQWGEFRHELGWQSKRWAVTDDQGRLCLTALVLRKPLPLGYSIFYSPEGPVVRGGDWNDSANQQAVTVLSAILKEDAKGARAILWKIDPHQKLESFPLDWLEKQGFKDSREDIQPAVIAEVDISPEEDQILANMKQKGRYNIRYAAKKGVEVSIGTSEEELNQWYELTKASAKRQGITYRSLDYFQKFRKHFMEQTNHAAFAIARYEGKPAAATLLTFFGNRATYLYGGSSAVDRNVFASYLVQWEGMKEAKKRGATIYNMTGIAHADDPSNPWYGLRQFKLKFGPEIVEVIGAKDLHYKPSMASLFTNADRGRRLSAKLLGRVRSQ